MNEPYNDLDATEVFECIKGNVKADRVGVLVGLILSPVIFAIVILILISNVPFIVTIILIGLGIFVEIILLILYIIITKKNPAILKGIVLEKNMVLSSSGGKRSYLTMNISHGWLFNKHGYKKEHIKKKGKTEKINTPEYLLDKIPENKEIFLVISATGVSVGFIENGYFKNNIANVFVGKQ